MREQTRTVISSLARIAWFTRVGVSDLPNCLVLSSWGQAVEKASSAEWENLGLEALNQYREDIAKLSPKRWEVWTDVGAEVREILIPFVDKVTAATVATNDLPKSFIDCVKWDLFGTCMEVEYSDVRPPMFFSGLANHYARGHFPCGWIGAYPKGKLIVY